MKDLPKAAGLAHTPRVQVLPSDTIFKLPPPAATWRFRQQYGGMVKRAIPSAEATQEAIFVAEECRR